MMRVAAPVLRVGWWAVYRFATVSFRVVPIYYCYSLYITLWDVEKYEVMRINLPEARNRILSYTSN